jgi:type IV pilus assembly protein PilC
MSQHYFYKAMDSRGRVTQGQINANNINDLEARLERMGFDLIDYKVQKNRHSRFGKVKRQELITFCFTMEQLTRAGVPIIAGLEDIRDSLSQSRLREVVSNLIENIQGGENLSEAMRHFPDVFDQVFVNLVNAGEHSGNLSKVFEHLTETLKWHDELVAKTKKLIMYPIFVGVVIIGVFFFLMLYLVPQLKQFFANMGKQLPMHTKILLYISDFMVTYWYIVILLPILLIIGFNIGLRYSSRLRFMFDRAKLRIWIIGPILEKIILARFANFFALLFGSGITVLDSLQISKKLAGNVIIEAAIQRVIDQIADGVGISESFERARLFPQLVLRMVKIGESTGELDAALLNVTYFYNREIRDSIDKIQTMIEPLMIVIMGLLLGWVMLSVLGPVYDMISKFDI